MTVFSRAVRDRRRGLVGWTVGIVALVLFTVALYPTIESNADFERVAEQLPPAMRAMFGFDDAVPLTSAPGYLQTRLFSSLLPLLLLVFAIGAGARAIGGSEEDGTLELLLMNPVTRRQVVIARFASVVALVTVLTLVSFVAIAVLALPFGALDDVSVPGLVAASAGAGLLALLHGSIAFTVGALAGRRAIALAVATAVAVAGYLVHGLIGSTDALDSMRFAVPWHWYLGRNMLAQGVAVESLLVPPVLCLVLVIAAAAAFQRRDLR